MTATNTKARAQLEKTMGGMTASDILDKVADAVILVGMSKGDVITMTALAAPQTAATGSSYLRMAPAGVKQKDDRYKNSDPLSAFKGKNGVLPEVAPGDKFGFNGTLAFGLSYDVKAGALVGSGTTNLNFEDQVKDVRKKASKAEATTEI